MRALTPIPALYRGFALPPDDPADPYAFRIDLAEYNIGSIRVVFSRGQAGTPPAVHLDVMPLTA